MYKCIDDTKMRLISSMDWFFLGQFTPETPMGKSIVSSSDFPNQSIDIWFSNGFSAVLRPRWVRTMPCTWRITLWPRSAGDRGMAISITTSSQAKFSMEIPHGNWMISCPMATFKPVELDILLKTRWFCRKQLQLKWLEWWLQSSEISHAAGTWSS